ncbi:MAG: hypothetical protein A07HR60_01984 [uncultured archaeon A07HR60]|nr:MAG: hypothetical protein A07HR60_01984 [uncultured archaeon A07HR60]
MGIKGSGDPTLTEIDRYDGGVGWIAYPDEGMERASHAITTPGDAAGGAEADVWVLDPVDAPGVDDLLAELGTVAGVVCCLERHQRDSDTIANRHNVAVHVPTWMDGVESDLDAPVERFQKTVANTDIRSIRVLNRDVPPWQEAGLFDGETLYVAESVGTADYFRAGDEALGVHPMLRLFPPRQVFDDVRPERVIVGHGEGVHDKAARALREALASSRRKAPQAYAGALKSILTG